MAILGNAVAGLGLAVSERQPSRVRRAIRQERKDGLRLALQLRLTVLGFVAATFF